MDEENYDFLKKLSNEEHGDVSKAVRELVNKGGQQGPAHAGRGALPGRKGLPRPGR